MINLHASTWLMLFVILIPYYVGRINLSKTTKEKYKLKPLIIITLIMLICGFINPYGIDAMLYLFKSYGFNEVNNYVGEMKALSFSGAEIIYVFYIIIVYFSYYLIKGNKINLRYLLLLLGTTYLGMSHLRGLMFFKCASLIVLCDNLSKISIEKSNGSKERSHEYSDRVQKDVG